MKNRFWILLAIICLLVGLASYLAWHNRPLTHSYRNTWYGYSLQLPSDWNVQTSQQAQEEFGRPQSAYADFSVSVQSLPEEYKGNLEAFVKVLERNKQIIQVTSTMIDGTTAYVGKNSNNLYEMYAKKDDRLYILTYSSDDAIREIIQSFHFIEVTKEGGVLGTP